MSQPTAMSRPTALRVEVVPYHRDNYAYLVHAPAAEGQAPGPRACVVVDPGDAAPVLAALEAHSLRPTAIWCTHHHPDHVAGVPAVLATLGPLPVLGSRHDLESAQIPSQTQGLDDGDTIALFGHVFRVLAVPGHTLGAIAYVGAGLAFTGDTLFLGGCGRVFEGTMSMMHASLARLAALDPATRLYVGHEYTEANLRFAAHVEPDDARIHARIAEVARVRAAQHPSVPATLAEERDTNPFLRCGVPSVVAFAQARAGHALTKEDEVFGQLREAKNAF